MGRTLREVAGLGGCCANSRNFRGMIVDLLIRGRVSWVAVDAVCSSSGGSE